MDIRNLNYARRNSSDQNERTSPSLIHQSPVNLGHFDFNYIEISRVPELPHHIMMTPSTDTLNISQLQVMTELDNLKKQVLSITKKLDYNLAVLKEKEDKNAYLTSVLIEKTRVTKEKSVLDEVNCSCGKGCLLF